MFDISRKNLPLPLDILHQLHYSLFILTDVRTSRALFEYASIELIDEVVDISASDVSIVLLFQNTHLTIGEAAGKKTELRMPIINEQYISLNGSI